MLTRKQLIEEIMASLHAARNKLMHGKLMGQGARNTITPSQWFVLCLIEQHANIGIKEISKMLGITSSATTQLVDGLVNHGYIKRKTNASDKRSLHLQFSKKGQTYLKKMKLRYAKSMEKLFKPLSNKELQIYYNLHKKILSHEV